MKKWRPWIGGGVVGLLALGLIHVYFVKVLFFPPIDPITQTPDEFNLPWEETRFQMTVDRKRLTVEGWTIEGGWRSHKWIILAHGRGRNRSAVLKFAPWLHQAGYNLLLFDFPGHGESTSFPVTLGAFEKDVLKKSVRVVKHLGARRIGVLGLSMGGTTAILSAAEEPTIKAVVAESPYTRFFDIVADRAWAEWKIPRFPLVYTVSAWGGLLYGFNPWEVDAVRAITKIAPRPIFLIHGDQDQYVPPRHSQELFRAAHHPMFLWVVQGAEHDKGFETAPEEYQKRVLEFFRKYL